MNAGADRLSAAFAGSGKRAALMPYLMACFPDAPSSLAIGEACARNGADVLEVGVPFSDPLADGPVIHAAATRALENGASVDGAIEVAAALAQQIPVALMCYSNPILLRGAEEFANLLAQHGISGLIVPDLPFEEAADMLRACDEAGVALVPLVAPTTTDERMRHIGAKARGFVYAVSLTGTTGERAALTDTFAELIARARADTTVPVALGFGISTPEQAAAAAASGADGVIIGSRLVRAAAEGGAEAVGGLVGEFAAALAV